jgi:hypothetical protein
MRIVEAIYIRQTCDVLEGLLAPNNPDDSPPLFDKAHLERLVLFSLMWSLGAVLELEDRDKMSEFVRKHASKLSTLIVLRIFFCFMCFHFQNGQKFNRAKRFLNMLWQKMDSGNIGANV